VGVIGLGREGLALSRFLLSIGADVVVTDDKPLGALAPAAHELGDGVALHAGGLYPGVLETDLCFVSPGVPLDRPELLSARANGVPLWNETGLFLWLCSAPSVGITGSSGKSTTTALVAGMAAEAGRRVHLGGNIGRPLIGCIDEIQADDLVVMELSSFQLELMRQSPTFAAVTNLTPNHLDRHHTMAAYVAAKRHIFAHQRAHDVTVLNADCRLSLALAEDCPGQVHWSGRRAGCGPGAHLAGDTLVLRRSAGESDRLCSRDELRLVGEHNVDNALCACALAGAIGLPSNAIRRALVAFAGLPHRLEVVAEVGGVTYINDSIATAPERSLAAVRSMRSPVVLLAGGRDKDLPWEEWSAEVARCVRAVVSFGEMGSRIVALLAGRGVTVRQASGLDEAVRLAQGLARPGDVVLLSPGGTSFDEFRDFEARGERFRQLVHASREDG